MNEFEVIINKLQDIIDSKRQEVPEEQWTVTPPVINREQQREQAKLTSILLVLKRKKEEAKKAEIEIAKLKNTNKNYNRFITNFGFSKSGHGAAERFVHRSLPYCQCGKQPIIQYVVDYGKWCVLCQKCYLMTENFDRIKDAMKAWQMKQFTETSLMLQNKLTRENVDDSGLTALAQEVCKVAAEDYIDSTSQSRKDLRKFFLESPLMLGTDGDAVIKKLEKISEEKRKEQIEKEVATA